MPFIYHDPASVANPANFVKSVAVLYDGGADGFSLAGIDWDGVPHVGMRWNVAEKERHNILKQAGEIVCHGAPAAKDIPAWFILPRELFNPVLFDKDSRSFLELVERWQG